MLIRLTVTHDGERHIYEAEDQAEIEIAIEGDNKSKVVARVEIDPEE